LIHIRTYFLEIVVFRCKKLKLFSCSTVIILTLFINKKYDLLLHDLGLYSFILIIVSIVFLLVEGIFCKDPEK